MIVETAKQEMCPLCNLFLFPDVFVPSSWQHCQGNPICRGATCIFVSFFIVQSHQGLFFLTQFYVALFLLSNCFSHFKQPHSFILSFKCSSVWINFCYSTSFHYFAGFLLYSVILYVAGIFSTLSLNKKYNLQKSTSCYIHLHYLSLIYNIQSRSCKRILNGLSFVHDNNLEDIES